MVETQWIGQNALKQRCSLSAVAGVYSHRGVDYLLLKSGNICTLLISIKVILLFLRGVLLRLI